MLVETITQFLDHVKLRLISQLNKGIYRVLQKSLKYFSGTIISTFLVPFYPAFFFFNWYSLRARLNSHYEAWSYKKRKHKKVKAYRKSI